MDPLGAGLDHRVYAVGDGLVARFGPGAEREARLLEAIAPRLPLPVPVPVEVRADCLILPRVAGTPLLEFPRAARRPYATGLLAFADAVHALTADVPDDDATPQDWLDDARRTWADVRDEVPATVERFLAAPAPAPAADRVLIHGDLGAEHVFVDGGRITGVIDWGDAAFGDPAIDHGRLLRDFGLPTGERARFYAVCTALEDVAFGVDRYRANALAALRELT